MKWLKNRKTILITLVLCVSFLLVVSQSAFATDGVKLSASSETGSIDDEIEVTISIENAEDTTGGQFDLSFDPNVVEPIPATDTDDVEEGDFVAAASNSDIGANLDLAAGDELRVLWYTPEADTAASGDVCTITFKILSDGETSLDFSEVSIAPEDIEAAEVHTSGNIEAVDPVDEKEQAIKDADEAIAALPDSEDIELVDKSDVEAARDLVDEAKDDYGAYDAEFEDLDKLVEAEEKIAKLEAIMTAEDAILALPSAEDLTLDDRADVVAARSLVDRAIDDYGAVGGDFDYLTILVAAEERIEELEGLIETPPTGQVSFWLPAGLLVIFAGLVAYLKRKQLAAK